MYRSSKKPVAKLRKHLLCFVAVDKKCTLTFNERVRERALTRGGDAEHKPYLSFLLCRTVAVELVCNLTAELLPRWRVDLIGRPECVNVLLREALCTCDVLLHGLSVVIRKGVLCNPFH